MPIKTVQIPDGRMVKVQVPEGTTEQQIIDFVTSEIQQQEKQQLLDQLSADVGPIESTAIAVGRGLTDIGRAVGLAEEETPLARQGLEGLRERRPITQTIGRAVGQALPFVAPGVGVGAIASTPLRIAAGAAVGGLEGATIAKGTGEGGISESAGIGAFIGGTAEAVFPIISRLGRALVTRIKGKKGKPPSTIFDDQGKPTQELQEALDQSGITLNDLNQQAQLQLTQQPAGVLPEQAARAAQFEQLGITPTRAQLTRGATDFQTQQEAAKTSGRVRGTLEIQEGLLVNKFDESIAGTRGNAVTSGSPVIDKVLNISTELDNKISDIYQRVKQSLPIDSNIKLNKLLNLVNKSRGQNRLTSGLVSAVSSELKNRGITQKSISSLGSDAIVKKEIQASRNVSIGQAEEIRQIINSFFDSTTGRGRQLIRKYKNALDDDVLSTAGKDFFSEARLAKTEFEKKLSRAKVSKFDSRKASLVRDILENKINPDTLVNDVINSKKWRASDLLELKQFSTNGGADLTPWNDLRAEVLDSIKNAAFRGPEDAVGNRALSRDGLQRALSRIGTEKLKVLFEPKELKFLRDVMNVAKLREPVRGTALGKGPSAQAIRSLESRIRNLPLVGSLVDFIDLDIQGRVAIRSNPAIKIRQRTNLEKVIPGAVSIVSIPLIAIEERQQ